MSSCIASRWWHSSGTLSLADIYGEGLFLAAIYVGLKFWRWRQPQEATNGNVEDSDQGTKIKLQRGRRIKAKSRQIIDAMRWYGRQVIASGREGDWESAVRALDKLVRKGATPTTVMYNAVMKASAKAYKTDLTLRLFDDMRQHNCKPDEVTYASLAVACKDRLEMSVDFFRRYIDKTEVVDVAVLNVVLGACVSKGHPQLALELFSELKPGRYVHTAFTYTALITACEKLGDPMEAMRYYDFMQEQGVQPEVSTYNALISCMMTEDFEIPLEIFAQMRAQGVSPNCSTYNTMIRCFSKSQKLGKVLGMFKEMKEAGIAPDVVTYGCVMNACNRVKKGEMVLQLFEEMRDKGIEPNLFAYNAAIKACDGNPRYSEKAMQLWREMKERGIKASLLTYNILITVCARGANPPLAHVLFDELKSMYQPDASTYCGMILACSKALDAEKALLYFQEMADLGFKPKIATYNMLLNSLLKGGQTEMALEIFHGMKESGPEPNASTYSTMIEWTTGELPELLYKETVELGIDICEKALEQLDKGRAYEC